MISAEFQRLVENELHQRLSLPGERGGGLYDPVRYIINIGGKRIRPALVAAGYSLYGSNPSECVTAAAALELFHNFTLVHDDIMDEAPLRRGQETVHRKWNSSTAILAGDAMLVLVYAWLEDYPEALPELLPFVNRCALRVCEGQQLDMVFQDRKKVSPEEYLEMTGLKTGELIGCCLGTGALIAGAGKEKAEKLREFGILQGKAFQIKDDLLDTFGGEGFGKKTGGDILSGKKTWLVVKAMEREPGELEKLFLLRGDERIEKISSLFKALDLEREGNREVARLHDSACRILDSTDGKKETREAIAAWFNELVNRSV